MAEDKEKKDNEDEGGKKKGLPPIVLVAVGAALGGAGMVFMSPAPEEHHEPAEPEPEYKLLEHPDVIKLHFNPRQDRGSMMARVEFRFVYKLDMMDEAAALKSIKDHWNQMYSRILLRLSRETPQGLKDPDNRAHIENDLITEMSLTLFPDGEQVVKQILWKDFYVQ